MSIETLTIADVDELCSSVEPWELQMSQLTPGKLSADMRAAMFGDIFITSERWSKKIAASGRTPSGFLVLAGPVIGQGFAWCGSESRPDRLAFSMNATEIDFLTWNGEHHWTALAPIALLQDILGEEAMQNLALSSRSIQVDPAYSRALCQLILELLHHREQPQTRAWPLSCEKSGESRLLASISRVLLNVVPNPLKAESKSVRFSAYRKARVILGNCDTPVPIDEVAARVGVSRRCLELGFREAIGLSPRQYMQRIRLNMTRHELLRSSSKSSTVTEVLQNWGFTELGRAAGTYRDFFEELPSESLEKNLNLPSLRYADLIGV